MGFPLEIITLGGSYLKYDVVPIRSSYRGIGRSLTGVDVIRPVRAKKTMDSMIEGYFAYIADTLEPESRTVFERMCSYCDTLNQAGVRCEVIVYDSQPLESAYGRQLAFLGIDIVHDMAESLLESGPDVCAKSLLNEYQLCSCVSDVPKVIEHCDHGGAVWLPCWVYRVV